MNQKRESLPKETIEDILHEAERNSNKLAGVFLSQSLIDMFIKTKPTMKKDTTKEPSMGTKDGMKHLRQPRQPRQNAGILQPIPRPKLLLVPFTLSLSESLLLRHVALDQE